MTEPEDTDIQRLIRLKKYEQPPEGFMDDFLVRLHHRQRSELLNQSSFSLFWERLVASMHGRVTPTSGLATAVATLLLVGGIVKMLPHGGTLTTVVSAQAAPREHESEARANSNRNMFAVSPFFGVESEDRVVPHMRPAELANYLSEHFRGGYADEQFYKVNGMLDPDMTGSGFIAAPLLDTPQNGSAKNIQR